MGTSPSPAIMTGTTCHHLGIMRPWWQVVLLLVLLAMDLEKKAAVAAVVAVANVSHVLDMNIPDGGRFSLDPERKGEAQR